MLKIRRLAFISIASLSLCLGVGMVFLPFDISELKPVLDYHPYQTVRFLSKEGEVFATLNRQRREVIDVGLIPPLVQQAFLVAEDSNFFYHFGLDLQGILRALILNTVQDKWQGRPMGGSTITQQVIKNIVLHNKRSLHSKVKEAFYAIQLEKRLSKNKILEIYLNEIYLGRGAYGVKAAAKTYFNKSLDDLRLSEIAFLAALPKAPGNFRYGLRLQPLKIRRDAILQGMAYGGLINIEEANEAMQEELPQARIPGTRRVGEYFAEEVRQQLLNHWGEELPYRFNFQVRTTLNFKLQQIVEGTLQESLLRIEKQVNKPRLPQVFPEITGAIVIMEVDSGKILAMTGGFNFANAKFNCATQALRQMGSAFKPFVYLTALEQGLTPQTIIDDSPLAIRIGNSIYRPRNWERKFFGPTSLATGLAQSRNVVTIKLAAAVGLGNVSEVAQRLGILNKKRYNPAVALGAVETTLLKLATAYAMIANGGLKVRPHFIESIYEGEKRLLWHPLIIAGPRVATIDNITTLQGMLRNVVVNGTAQRLNRLPFLLAGKTGSTSANKDLWFVGFSDNILVGVFIGFPRPRSLGDKSGAAKIVLPIVEELITRISDAGVLSFPKKIINLPN